MREFRVFVYENENKKSGEYNSLEEALVEGYVTVQGYKLQPTDELSVIEEKTRLIDKNKKDIWEGDIVNGNVVLKSGGGRVTVDYIFRGIVVWDNDTKNMIVNREFGLSMKIMDIMEYSLEVIGNIHENPELWNY